MKVLLYFENENTIKQSGIGRALKHQIEALNSANIAYTLNPKDDFDIAHINTYFFKSKHLLKKMRKKHIPVIVHGHSSLEDFANSFRCWKLVYHLWYKPNLLWFYHHADFIVAPTKYTKILIESYNPKCNVEVVSNGVNVDEYLFNQERVDLFKKRFAITDEKVVIGVGWPFNRKGIKDFFIIASKNPKIKFIWFGSLKKILTERNVLKAIKSRPNNVIMPGYVSGDVIKGAYHYASCLLFPSYEETEGIVVLEALASKCPLLIRDIPVYKDWLVDGFNCYKGTTNDELDIKLKQILTTDNTRIVNEGYKVAQERNLTIIGQQLKKIYQQLSKKAIHF